MELAMTTSRFLVAKYVPDRLRMEPRNIGVVLWTPERVLARFRGESIDQPGQVDGRAVRFTNDTRIYKRWIRYWRQELSKQELLPPAGGPRVRRTEPGFVEALLDRTRASYYLEDGGLILDPVQADDTAELLGELYGRLVEEPCPTEPAEPSTETHPLQSATQRLLSESGVRHDPHLRTDYPLSVPLDGGILDAFEFSLAYANGSLQALYQVLELPRTDKSRQMVARAQAFVFERVLAARLVDGDRCGALVYLSEEERADAGVEHALNVLRSTTRVFDLADARQGFLPLQEELRRLGKDVGQPR